MTTSEPEPAITNGTESPAGTNEIERALDADQTRLGEVWRLGTEKPPEIAKQLGVATTGFVYSYRRITAALVDGELPSKPTPAKQVGSALRGFAKRHEDGLSEHTIARLEELAKQCDRVANDPAAIAQEDSADQKQTEEVEKRDTPGIYVYTYPHYLRHPVLPGLEHEGTGSGRQPRTYFKVGRSGRGVKERIANQMRGTAVPERPSLLRIYTTASRSDLKSLEERLHKHLKAADHGRERSNDHGTEWFLAHLEFLDDTADLLGLLTHYEPLEDDQADAAT